MPDACLRMHVAFEVPLSQAVRGRVVLTASDAVHSMLHLVRQNLAAVETAGAPRVRRAAGSTAGAPRGCAPVLP